LVPTGGIHGQPWPDVSRPVRPERAGQLKSPEPPARGSLRDLAIGIDAGEIDSSVWGPYPTAGPRGFRSSRSDGGPQVLRPGRAPVPPWLHAKSGRASNLLACCALGPPASAAQYSCRREPCTGRSAWLPLGRACLSAWIEPRSGEQRSARAQSVRARAQEVQLSFLTIPPPSPGPAHYRPSHSVMKTCEDSPCWRVQPMARRLALGSLSNRIEHASRPRTDWSLVLLMPTTMFPDLPGAAAKIPELSRTVLRG
jgi:hypothetical protein